MSAFTIGGVRYEVAVPTADWPFDSLDGPRPRSMNARLSDAVSSELVFHYEYDFGSTTALRLKVASGAGANVDQATPLLRESCCRGGTRRPGGRLVPRVP